ncbi:Hypothetical predicted protein [Cloeon dipterum]|uniref:Peptidase S1 domain-containing protein n=1 Tax=Cloeon dipterum TaxID=197152 RepID=A0A8S1CTI8_9INSE|nr:Hypothetical predicted protein [Cloeon dipterum]
MNKLLILLLAAFAAASEEGPQKVVWMDPIRDVQMRPRAVDSRLLDVDGGRPADDGDVAYQAGILANHGVFCSGSLITESAILTIAHCVDGRNVWEIYLGKVQLVSSDGDPDLKRHVIFSNHGIVHEQYDALSNTNAVAIIRLPGPVTFSKYIKPILLPKLSQIQEWQQRSGPNNITGWGIATRGEMNPEDRLKVIITNIISNDDCGKVYGASTIHESMLCFEQRNTSPASCYGDAGAPIVVEDNVHNVQIGIVLYGSRQQCSDKLPGMAIRTAPFVEWIASHGGPAVRP